MSVQSSVVLLAFCKFYHRIMRANTPMTMCAMSSGIVHLEYFYSTSTMMQTNLALINTFLDSGNVLNGLHLPSRALLRQVAHFYYLGLVEKSIDTAGEIKK